MVPSASHPHPVTLRRLAPGTHGEMEADLSRWSRRRPVTLILPCHIRDARSAALRCIIRELAGASWIRRVIVGIDGAGAQQADAARAPFAGLPQEVRVLWTGSAAVRSLEADLSLPSLPSGKGRNVWLCAGVALSFPDTAVVAVQDCDIRKYTRELAIRLCWPVVNPDARFVFCKGFYRRHAAQLNGRVSRLLMRPLLQALTATCGPAGPLQFVREFHYPLAGESAFDAPLLRQLPMVPDWGLETGILLELSGRPAGGLFCQSELCDRYEHKHQDLSPSDPTQGLHAMATAIIRTLLSGLGRRGITLDSPACDRVQEAFNDGCHRAIQAARAEAAMNGMKFHGDAEELAVRTFAGALQAALEAPIPGSTPFLPSWCDVLSARPDAASAIVPDPL